MFKKILVANRGEIAVRVMRTCREMGIRTVAVYSDADRTAFHVSYAEEAYRIGAAPSTESYLSIERIMDAARKSSAEAIHPGYGFLSENPEFARACRSAKIVFIGPPPEAMELMGSKTASRHAVKLAGLPLVPGTDRNLNTLEEVKRVAAEIGFPVMLKAAAGGGGKGLRLVAHGGELESAYRTAQSEAQNAFNDASLYIEKYLERPRHIEIQVLGDTYGNIIHLGERECSLQRRHQKVMEESPSPFIDESLRQKMGEAALAISRIAGYTNAGTVEFLVDQNRHFYFLEMNTRLQVEHPVTELVFGVDLVKEQIRVAAGEPLPWRQEQLQPRGWSLECRIYAEDPDNNFFPSPGMIEELQVPGGPGVRDDSGVFEGWTAPIDYDPLLSKLAVWGEDRAQALARMRRALGEYEVSPIKTNIPFFRRVVDDPKFVAGDFDTRFVDQLLADGFANTENCCEEEERVAMYAAVLESIRMAHRQLPAPRGARASEWKAAGRRALLQRDR
ncbi:MAG TPA: acetyl-CoA carboxylase biotin carboxylase subunit [Terriglobia bacterium]|nr:acetyl-CoA carboxylase biotin carboxylase subunit [Terriglobia bacterium]